MKSPSLEQSNKEMRVFSLAEAYLFVGATAIDMQKTFVADPKFVTLGAPPVLLSSFAMELYLKCLLIISGRSVPTDHNLEALFNCLRSADKKRVRSLYRTRLNANPEIRASKAAMKLAMKGKQKKSLRFNDALKTSARAFVDTRYIWEAVGKSANWAAGPILNSIRDRILELRPAFHSSKFLQG